MPLSFFLLRTLLHRSMGNEVSVLRDECANRRVVSERKMARLLDIKDYLARDFALRHECESILDDIDKYVESNQPQPTVCVGLIIIYCEH